MIKPRNRNSMPTKYSDHQMVLIEIKRKETSMERLRIISLYKSIGILSFVIKSFKRVIDFSKKEKLILRGTMHRKSNKELCKELGLSPQDLAHSRQEIVRKVEEVFESSPNAFSGTQKHIIRGIAKGKTFEKIASEGGLKEESLKRELRKLHAEYQELVSEIDPKTVKEELEKEMDNFGGRRQGSLFPEVLPYRVKSRTLKETLGEPIDEDVDHESDS